MHIVIQTSPTVSNLNHPPRLHDLLLAYSAHLDGEVLHLGQEIYHYVQLSDTDLAPTLVEEINALPEVNAAYIKPDVLPPA